MNFLWRVLLIVLFLIVQVSLFIFYLPSFLVPDLVLILIVCWSLLAKKIKSVIILAFLAGLLLDFFSDLPAGVLALGLMTISLCLTFFRKTVFIRKGWAKLNFWRVLIFILLVSLVFEPLIWLEIKFFNLVKLTDFELGLSYDILLKSLLRAFINLIFATGIYWLLRKLEKEH